MELEANGPEWSPDVANGAEQRDPVRESANPITNGPRYGKFGKVGTRVPCGDGAPVR